LPEYNQGPYDGATARVGAGLEAWELYSYMDKYNMTIFVPGGSTVGAYGGWFLGGGHSVLASTYGLGSDQALSLQVVTADGRFVTADPTTNANLFYALRGGGPGQSTTNPMISDAHLDYRYLWHRDLSYRQGVSSARNSRVIHQLHGRERYISLVCNQFLCSRTRLQFHICIASDRQGS
jgi:FAD binding domain